MIKKIVSLVIFLLLANAGFRLALVFFHDQQFNDAVRETALFGSGKPDDALRTQVMQVASQHSVPIDRDFIEITRRSVVTPNDKVVIRVSYAVMVQLAPGYSRRFDFTYTTP